MMRTIKGIQFTECTAIAASIGDTERQSALFMHDTADEFCNGDSVVFGYDLPQDEDDVQNILGDYNAISTDAADIETVEF